VPYLVRHRLGFAIQRPQVSLEPLCGLLLLMANPSTIPFIRI
jgi:hypothetical protein